MVTFAGRPVARKEFTMSEVSYERRGPVAWITLNRPQVLNALTPAMISDVRRAGEDAQADDDIRVVVITGTGRGFCSGFDIKMFSDMDLTEVWHLGKNLTAAWSSIRKLPKPTIAALNGVAAGGGFELALACDLRIAAHDARLGSGEVRINQPTTNGSSFLLSRLIGESKAKELCLTGNIISAEEAARIGLVNAVAEPDQFGETVQNWADKIAGCGPIAVSKVKGFFEQGRTMSADAVVAMEEEAAIDCFLTEDQQEGFSAFLEKRKPSWSGR